MNEFAKRYQVWCHVEGNQFAFEEFDTLAECIKAPKYGDWYITKRVSLAVSDADEKPQTIISGPQTPYVPIPAQVMAEPENEVPDPVLTAYLRGGTGAVKATDRG